jgi:hypothetical protein
MVPRWRVLQANKKKVCLAVLMMGKHVFLLKKNHLSFVRAMMRQLAVVKFVVLPDTSF